MLKKYAAVLLSLILITAALCSCSGPEKTDDKLKIVCSVFPYYDWVKNITGENEKTELVLLLDNGTDPHSYEPTAADIITVSSADIFIFTGGESDSWAKEILKNKKSENTVVLELMECLGEEKLLHVEENNEAEEHDHEGHNNTFDEHIWLSLKNAALLTDIITEAVIEKDIENKEIYEENCKNYKDRLLSLNEEFEKAVLSAENDTLIFADRFPFVYLTKDYGLKYYAAFPGCSAEIEASFETVTRLADKIDELSLSCILITETSDGAVAKTVKNSTKAKNQEILTLNSIQSVTSDKMNVSYLEIMNGNLSVLKNALNLKG